MATRQHAQSAIDQLSRFQDLCFRRHVFLVHHLPHFRRGYQLRDQRQQPPQIARTIRLCGSKEQCHYLLWYVQLHISQGQHHANHQRLIVRSSGSYRPSAIWLLMPLVLVLWQSGFQVCHSAQYKVRILEEANVCTEAGQVGALLRREVAYKLQMEIGKAIYSLRKSTAEPVIGIIKEVLGFRQFSLRGLIAAAGEWCLVCLAWNLKRLHTLATS